MKQIKSKLDFQGCDLANPVASQGNVISAAGLLTTFSRRDVRAAVGGGNAA